MGLSSELFSTIDENNKIMSTKNPPPTQDNFRIFTSSFPLSHLRCVFFLLWCCVKPTSTQQWFDCVKEKCRKLLSFPHCDDRTASLLFSTFCTPQKERKDFSRTLSSPLRVTASARPQCYQWVSSEKLLFIVFHLIKSISAQLIRYIFHKAEKKMFLQPQWIQVSGNDTERRVDEAKRESFLFFAHTSELFVSVKVCRWPSCSSLLKQLNQESWLSFVFEVSGHYWTCHEKTFSFSSILLCLWWSLWKSRRKSLNFPHVVFLTSSSSFSFQCSDIQWCVL